ncbi:MAG: hypothetical protein Q8L47_04290 [bacterium]|nr:hypothetical protein [bacterium]
MTKEESLPTQDFIAISEIKNDVVYLKTGGLRKILLVSGINTELKSEEEQNTIFSLFQNFLNGVDFPLQLVVHSRKLNIENYLEFLDSRRLIESNELLKSGIEEYIEFIKSFVQDNAIMTKNFFIVVSYDPLISSASTGLLNSLPFIGKRDAKSEEEKSEQENIAQLNQRSEQVIASIRAVGLRAIALNNTELTELFYNLYNPETVEKKLVM